MAPPVPVERLPVAFRPTVTFFYKTIVIGTYESHFIFSEIAKKSFCTLSSSKSFTGIYSVSDQESQKTSQELRVFLLTDVRVRNCHFRVVWLKPYQADCNYSTMEINEIPAVLKTSLASRSHRTYVRTLE